MGAWLTDRVADVLLVGPSFGELPGQVEPPGQRFIAGPADAARLVQVGRGVILLDLLA